MRKRVRSRETPDRSAETVADRRVEHSKTWDGATRREIARSRRPLASFDASTALFLAGCVPTEPAAVSPRSGKMPQSVKELIHQLEQRGIEPVTRRASLAVFGLADESLEFLAGDLEIAIKIDSLALASDTVEPTGGMQPRLCSTLSRHDRAFHDSERNGKTRWPPVRRALFWTLLNGNRKGYEKGMAAGVSS